MSHERQGDEAEAEAEAGADAEAESDADGDADPESGTRGSEVPSASPKLALLVAGGVTLATAAAIGFAFDPDRAGHASVLVSIGTLYALLGALAIVRMRRRGDLRAALRPAGGDLTIGALVAALLYGAAMAAHLMVMPLGTPREAWLINVYLQLGDPRELDIHLVGAAVFAIAALEELVWRGLVMRVLAEPFGVQRAWLLSTVLFGIAHLPAAYMLRGGPGLNPLLPVAALGCGFVWGYLVLRTRRLVPALFCHALFTWAVIEFPIWRPYLELLGS
jgi:uncharacterized protein